ncbi:unnamed protein product [Acanthosepion pharaonis]|uniref:Uncharacterized protein n=1 Tax=Acanthosepion pharaonis TaxID=158019 RepID=A0A812EAI9_ACAPH|nr:unnamed protein product [Sepia pharaonis]
MIPLFLSGTSAMRVRMSAGLHAISSASLAFDAICQLGYLLFRLFHLPTMPICNLGYLLFRLLLLPPIPIVNGASCYFVCFTCLQYQLSTGLPAISSASLASNANCQRGFLLFRLLLLPPMPIVNGATCYFVCFSCLQCQLSTGLPAISSASLASNANCQRGYLLFRLLLLPPMPIFNGATCYFVCFSCLQCQLSTGPPAISSASLASNTNCQRGFLLFRLLLLPPIPIVNGASCYFVCFTCLQCQLSTGLPAISSASLASNTNCQRGFLLFRLLHLPQIPIVNGASCYFDCFPCLQYQLSTGLPAISSASLASNANCQRGFLLFRLLLLPPMPIVNGDSCYFVCFSCLQCQLSTGLPAISSVSLAYDASFQQGKLLFRQLHLPSMPIINWATCYIVCFNCLCGPELGEYILLKSELQLSVTFATDCQMGYMLFRLLKLPSMPNVNCATYY